MSLRSHRRFKDLYIYLRIGQMPNFCLNKYHFSHPSASPIRSSSSIHLNIPSTLAPNPFLPGDGTSICSGHGAVFCCAERPSQLNGGLEKQQSLLDSGPLGQMEVVKAAPLSLFLDSQPHHPQQAALGAAGKPHLRI